MSPFTAATDRIADQLRGVGVAQQVALYVCAAQNLSASLGRWRDAVGGGADDDSELFRRASDAARTFAVDGITPTATLLAEIERATPAEPSDVAWFTAAQDCWICLDTSIRIGVEAYDGAESSWYLLEPMFQAASERLVGLSDVGSANQAAEARALADPRLRTAIDGVHRAIDLANTAPPSDESLRRITEALQPINPD